VQRPRVLLADDHKLLLESFQKLLEPDYEVVGTATDGRALLAAAQQLQPDLIVVDISMPLLNGLEAGRRLRQSHPKAKLIFLTMNQDISLAAEAFDLGASGFLLKSSAASELRKALQLALRGKSYITPLLGDAKPQELVKRRRRRRHSQELSPRQREILQLLAEGLSMKQVAAQLDLTPRTVAFHKYRLMEQLRLKSSAELVQYAIKHRIVSL
jgi:DNA-binding NarL/FixJ family response regulator